MGKTPQRELFGYNEPYKSLWFDTNQHLPNGSFTIQKRRTSYYWYFVLGAVDDGSKNRNKYICRAYEGKNDDGFDSFQLALQTLSKKFESNFRPTIYDTQKLSELVDEYIGLIIKEENSDDGRKLETTQSLKNSMMRFKEFCLQEDIILRDVKKPKELKNVVKKYLEYSKNRRTPPLKRNTIRTYMKVVCGNKGFLSWLADDDGRDVIDVNPINSDYINKIYPTTRKEKKGIGDRNPYYSDESYKTMFKICGRKVSELYQKFCEDGWSRENNNQPFGVGSDVVYFISLFQLHSGFRIGEILSSYRNREYWENRRDKKNSSTYWNQNKDGEWFLYLEDFKGKDGNVPINQKIRTWVKPKNWKDEPTKLDNNGKPLYWDVQLVDVCLEMFRESPFVFSSPNYFKNTDRHYSKTYYQNIFRQMMVSKGVGGEGWERHGISSSHHLRSYYISYMINNGMPIEDLAQITRHNPTTLWKYYLRYSEKGQLKRQASFDRNKIFREKLDINKRDG